MRDHAIAFTATLNDAVGLPVGERVPDAIGGSRRAIGPRRDVGAHPTRVGADSGALRGPVSHAIRRWRRLAAPRWRNERTRLRTGWDRLCDGRR